MLISEFQEAFNRHAEETNQEFRITRIDTPEDNADGSPGTACTFTAADYLSGIIHVNAGEIESVQTVTKPGRAVDGAKSVLFNAVLIDVMTGWGVKRRNKLLHKLGYINGSCAKGSTVTEGGYRFKAGPALGIIMFSLRVLP